MCTWDIHFDGKKPIDANYSTGIELNNFAAQNVRRECELGRKLESRSNQDELLQTCINKTEIDNQSLSHFNEIQADCPIQL